jgi:plasmid stability protein
MVAVMGVNLSIKNVPEDVVARLKEQAKRNHRSLQGELRSVIEASLPKRGTLTLEEISRRNKERGFASPSESTQMVREDRDR